MQRGLILAAVALFLTGGVASRSLAGDAPPVAPRAPSAPAPGVVRGGMGAVVYLRYSPDGRTLVRVPQFGLPSLLSVEDPSKERTFRVGMRTIAFSPDGSRLATAEGTDGARIFDAADPGVVVAAVEGATASAVRVIEKAVRVLEEPPQDRRQRVFRAEFSPDGRRLVTTRADGHVKVWDTTTWSVERDIALGDTQVRAAAFSPDAKILALGDSAGVLHRWDLAKGTDARLATERGGIADVEFSRGGGTVITTHPGRGVVVAWDAEWKPALEREPAKSAAFSWDGRVLAIGGGRIELLDTTTWKTTRILELESLTLGVANPLLRNQPEGSMKVPVSVTALAFAPDGRTLAAGCADGTIRLIPTAP